MAKPIEETNETVDLEKKYNDVVQQLYQKEQEIEQLKAALEQQARGFERCVANLVFNIFGGQ